MNETKLETWMETVHTVGRMSGWFDPECQARVEYIPKEGWRLIAQGRSFSTAGYTANVGPCATLEELFESFAAASIDLVETHKRASQTKVERFTELLGLLESLRPGPSQPTDRTHPSE